MQQAKAVAMTIYLYCPHCDEAMEDDQGSLQITSDSFRGDTAQCVHCGTVSKLPKTARLFS